MSQVFKEKPTLEILNKMLMTINIDTFKELIIRRKSDVKLTELSYDLSEKLLKKNFILLTLLKL